MCAPKAFRGAAVAVAALLLAALAAGCIPVPQPELAVRPDAVTLSLARTSGFDILNVGEVGSTLSFVVSSSAPWLLLEPTEGRVEAGRAVSVSVRLRSGAEPEDEAVVLVATNAGSARVRVSVGEFEGATVCASDRILWSQAVVDPWPGAERRAEALEPVSGPPSAAGTSEVLVVYHRHAVTMDTALGRAALASELAARSGARLVRAGAGSQHDLMRLPPQAAASARAALERDPRVAAVLPNLPIYRLGAPNDPFYPAQWWAWCFGLEEAWGITTGAVTEGTDPTVVVAVIDDGFNVTHRDIEPKLLPGFDFAEWNDDVRSPFSPHGTHVAGIALALGNNATAIAGVAHGASVRLLPIKVFPDDVGRTGSLDALLNGMRWAVGLPVGGVATNPYPAQVVNMSLGVKYSPDAQQRMNSAFDPVVADMRAQGAVLVAAAGNDGLDPPSAGQIQYPARTEGVIAVGSVDYDGVRSGFSSYGPGLELMAPGGAAAPDAGGCPLVLSLGPSGTSSTACLGGTSMAAPFVAGTAALLIAQHPERYRGQPAAVEAQLFGTALKTHAMSTDEYGAGIVCADAALGAPSRCGWPPVGGAELGLGAELRLGELGLDELGLDELGLDGRLRQTASP